MLHGELVTLRPVREADLDAMYDAHVAIRNRGAFFNDGRDQDVLLYSMLRGDPRPWHEAEPGPPIPEDGGRR